MRSERRVLQAGSCVAAWATWLIVAGLSALVVKVTYQSTGGTGASLLISIVVGLVVLVSCVFLAEGIWRSLRFVMTLGLSEKPRKHSPEASAIRLIERVYDKQESKLSRIESRWPDSDNPLIKEARAILRDSVGTDGDSIDAEKLREHNQRMRWLLQELIHMARG